MTGPQLVVVLLLCMALRALFVWSRGRYHRFRLPPPSLAADQVDAFRKQVFRELCRRSDGPRWRVDMADYFIDRGWNRADAMLILAEPLKHGLIRIQGWRFGTYGLTRRGWAEYRKNFMWTGGSEMHISATSGGFIVANVNSDHAVAQGGRHNSADVRDVSHRQLINALREDARSADTDESLRAQEYADDLAEAVQTANADRTERILGRINALLASATSAFALTRDLLRPGA